MLGKVTVFDKDVQNPLLRGMIGLFTFLIIVSVFGFVLFIVLPLIGLVIISALMFPLICMLIVYIRMLFAR